jgi:hypothetical protein
MARGGVRPGTLVRVAFALLFTGAIACSGSDGDGDGCPEGTVERSSTNDATDRGAETREDAIRAELEDLELAATDDAIVAAVIAGSPGASAGTERVRIATVPETGSITMVLDPLEPGWAVRSTSYCVPDDAVSG